MLNDLEYALRGLRRDPGFTTVAVLTLALGIGANTAVFNLVRAVFLAPLPFADADRLVSIAERRPTSRDANLPISGHEYAAWREQNTAFESLALHRPERLTLTGAGDPEMVEVLRASTEYLPLLRMRPGLGRIFAAGEDRDGAHVAILSDAFWRTRFGADPAALGRAITLDNQSYMVIGILSPLPPSLTPDVVLPINLTDELRAAGRHRLSVIGRLKPGATLRQAQSNLDQIAARLAAEYPDTNTGHEVILTPLREDLVGGYRRALVLLMGAVGCVLLIGCVNVANLLLARGASRHKEIAIRVALGATRARVTRQLIADGLALAALGGAAGLLLSAWIMDLVPAITAVDIPLIETARLDWTAFALCAAISVAAGLAAGVAPALASSRIRPAGLGGGRRASDDASRQRLRSMLVASEVALTLVLLVGAGLMIASFAKLVSTDPGFRTKGVLVVPVDLPAARYAGAADRRTFYDRLLERLRAIPGVEAAGAVSNLPLGGSDNWMQFTLAGRPAPEPGHENFAAFRMTTPDYFRALGIPLTRGRFFTPGDARMAVPLIRWFPQQPQPPGFDRPQAAPVAIVSETAARRFWPGEDPIGRQIRVLFSPDITIVGTVGDIKHNGLDAPASPHIYLAHSQEPWGSVSVVVRTSGADLALAPALRAEVHALDPGLPVTVRTMDDVVGASVGQPRFYALMIGLFGAVALALAVVGIFGVVSYVTAGRTREIGVRVALGARPREIHRLVIGQGMRPIAAGIAAGIGAALLATRQISSLLFGVTPADPLTFATVVLLLTAVGLTACWLPARRVSRVDPVTALRAE